MRLLISLDSVEVERASRRLGDGRNIEMGVIDSLLVSLSQSIRQRRRLFPQELVPGEFGESEPFRFVGSSTGLVDGFELVDLVVSCLQAKQEGRKSQRGGKEKRREVERGETTRQREEREEEGGGEREPGKVVLRVKSSSMMHLRETGRKVKKKKSAKVSREKRRNRPPSTRLEVR